MSNNKVTINWFEIPVSDMARAKTFYQAALQAVLMPMEQPDGEMQAFLSGETPVGALVAGAHNSPSTTGSLIYFDAGGDIDAALARVEAAGGSVAVPKVSIGAFGHIAQFIDSEGNRIALHSA